MIPTDDLREVHAAAPILPWAHTHGEKGKKDVVTFYSPSRPDPLFTVEGANEATMDYLVMAVNNFENLLDIIDRPAFPDQFRDLTDDERQQLQVEKITAITKSMKDYGDKHERKDRRRMILSMTVNGALIGTLLTTCIINVIVGINT